MTEPFKLACHCGFSASDPQAFVDHLLVSQHIDVPPGAAEDGSIGELVEIFKNIQTAAANPDKPLPEGMSARPISAEDILADDDLDEDDKQTLLANLDAVHALIRKREEGE